MTSTRLHARPATLNNDFLDNGPHTVATIDTGRKEGWGCAPFVRGELGPRLTQCGMGRGHIVLDGDPVPPKGGGAQRPNFGPMSVVAKRSPVSATAEHFFHYRIQTKITAQL